MNVHLTNELEQLVQHHVKSGRYGSESEVVSEALRLLAEQDEVTAFHKQEFREKIAQGLDSLLRDESIDGHEFFAQLERDETMLESKRQLA